ncbi:restriction endonuclease [bacterium]|nr:restriction endonuclease [bacterium]
MEFYFDSKLALKYHSKTQAVRVMSEKWVKQNIYCPNCGSDLSQFKNNTPVGDFFCSTCSEQFELKSKKGPFSARVVDGAYQSMIDRLQIASNPNFFFLHYDPNQYSIINFTVVPKHFFYPDIIEKRSPLSSLSRRAGWIGCNILYPEIPGSGKIFYIKNQRLIQKEQVLDTWQSTLFLRDAKKELIKGWLLDIIKCLDQIGKSEFTLNDVYAFEKILSKKYTQNKHIRDKIRQQLQFLRNKGFIEFISPGLYRRRGFNE